MFSILLWIPVLAEEVSLDVFQAIERRTAVISSLPLFRPLFAPIGGLVSSGSSLAFGSQYHQCQSNESATQLGPPLWYRQCGAGLLCPSSLWWSNFPFGGGFSHVGFGLDWKSGRDCCRLLWGLDG